MFEHLKLVLKRSSRAYKREAVKNLNYIYMIASGFWHEKDLDRKLKYLWVALNILPHIVQFTASALYYLTKRELTMEDHIKSCTPIFGSILFCSMIFSTHFFSPRIVQLLRIMDKDLDTSLTVKKERTPKKPISTLFESLYYLLPSMVAVSAISLVVSLFRGRDFGTSSFYYFTFLGMDKVTSRGIYAVIYIGQFFTAYLGSAIIVEILIFVDLLIMEISNEASIIVEILQENCKMFKDRLKLLHRTDRRDEAVQSRKLKEILEKQVLEKKLKVCNNFRYELIQCVRHYQLLVKKLNSSRPILEYIMSVFVSFLFVKIVLYGFFSSKISSMADLMRGAVGFTGLVFTEFYMHYIGDMYAEMNDIIAGEVYALPWHELPPSHRKDVLMMLTLTQKSLELRGLKVFPGTLKYVPTIANNIYSYILNLRNLGKL